MTKMMTRTCGSLIAFGVLSLSLGASASAQDAVQWRVEDGGNGHWYQVSSQVVSTWDEAMFEAVTHGGHLVCFETQAEHDWFRAWSPLIPQFTAWIGLSKTDQLQDPTTGWFWVTGPRAILDWGWGTNEPEDRPKIDEWCGGVNSGGQDPYLFFDAACSVNGRNLIIEWSADCNGDGIVDYGQILDGPLIDGDENGIPDCCEESNCPSVADLDGDGCVDGTDLSALLGAWGLDDPKVGDLDGDGTVRGSDLTILLSEWSPCP